MRQPTDRMRLEENQGLPGERTPGRGEGTGAPLVKASMGEEAVSGGVRAGQRAGSFLHSIFWQPDSKDGFFIFLSGEHPQDLGRVERKKMG